MQHFVRTSALLGILMAIGACAHKPIVDMKGVDPQQYQLDLAECDAYADEVRVGQKAGAGAVGGAAVWGAIGAIFGNSSDAARGAGSGAVYGGARGTEEGVREKHQVVSNCLRYRGYAVLN